MKIYFWLCPLLMLFGCQREVCEKTKFLMNTSVEIKVIDVDKNKSNSAIGKAFQEINRISKLLNRYDENSMISQLDRKRKIKASRELIDLMRKSIKYSKITDGSFDITIYPLIKLWNFKSRIKQGKKVLLPSKTEISKVKSLVDYRNIKITDNTITLGKLACCDLGGIAKGYAVDQAIKTLKSSGINTALVNAGGDIRVIGKKTWKIGIQHPRKTHGEIIAVVPVRNKAVVTSGDYERYFIKEGVRYHHILNPKTGYPANKCMSVTIVTNDATSADALSTGIFVLGPEKGMKLIEETPEVEGIIIDNQGKLTISSGLKSQLSYP